VGQKHLKLKLSRSDTTTGHRHGPSENPARPYDAILFSSTSRLPEVIEAVYRLQVNEFNGSSTLQFIVDHWSPAGI
jgi:single-stranded-DNA-specific exonuclease